MAWDPAHLGALIGSIYDAAMDERRWPEVMERLTCATESQAAWLFVLRDAEAPDFVSFEFLNFDPDMISGYVSEMGLHDPFLRYSAAHPERVLVHDNDVITEAEKRRHLYYDWHRQRSDTWHRLVAITSPAPRLHAGLALHRTRRAGDYDGFIKGCCGTLFEHLERALLIACRLGMLGQVSESGLALLEESLHGAFLFDRSGRVVHTNRAGRDLIEAQDGLVMENGTLRLQQSADHRSLARLIQDVVDAANSDGSGGVIVARRPSGLRPYVVLVAPLPGVTSVLGASCLVGCVLVTDLERPPEVPVDLLCTLFGLTPSEARLAAQLSKGDELRAAAEVLSITYATARSTLTTIFRKTRTRRQAELMRLLATASPLLVRRPIIDRGFTTGLASARAESKREGTEET